MFALPNLRRRELSICQFILAQQVFVNTTIILPIHIGSIGILLTPRIKKYSQKITFFFK